MKANKFIKDFGINEAKQILEDLSFNEWRKDKVYFDEILRLIESHELIDRVGGIDRAKEIYQNFECIHIDLDLISCRSIGKAMSNMESCQ